MYEIKRLHSSLNRLDVQFNRDKRGLREEATVVDCVQMKGKFNKIYEDLNRISKALSTIDDNGICRCKCPLDTEDSHFTKLSYDQTTFAPINLNEHAPGTGEKTKQLKKIIFSKYTPLSATNQLSSVSEYGIITSTSNEEKEFTTMLSSTVESTTNQENTDRTVDTKGDLSPEMSIAVTNIVNREDDTRTTVGPQIIYFTGTIDNEEIQTHITFDTSTSSTGIMDPNETIGTTELNNDKITTTYDADNYSNKDVISNLTSENENISEPTTEILRPENNHNNTYNIITKYSGSLYENENISNSTTDVSKLDNKYSNIYILEKFSESTSENENVLGSTTEISELDINHSKTYYDQEKTSRSISENENTSGSTTEISELYNNYSETYVTEETSESTSKIENITKSITVTSKPGGCNNYSNTNITDRTVDLMIENKNIIGSITEMPVSNENKNKTIVNERTSSEDRGEKHFDKPRDGQNYPNQSIVIGNTNKDDDDKSTLHQPEVIQQIKVQPKTYPICFYPAPCSPNIVNYQQINELKDTSKNPIQYTAQSLSTYKRKPPVATVIQNDYPVLLICRTDVVCSVADFAGQPNRLHCMYSVDVNKNNDNNSNQTIKNIYNSTKNAAAVTDGAKSTARNNDDILTGNNKIYTCNSA